LILEDTVLKIGVLSDTHLTGEDLEQQTPMFKRLESICNSSFKNVEHLIHAGDTVEVTLLQFLTQYAPTTIVKGNCDIGPGIDKWPEITQIELGGVQIAVAHERSSLYKLINKPIQIFIFGHSHIPYLDEFEPGRFWLNPGSVKRPSGPNARPSVALIEINHGNIKIEHLYF
jgi:putative phosphoesterase